jgi:hypothetical protein
MGGCRWISLFTFLSKHNNPQRARFVVLINYTRLNLHELKVIIKFCSYRPNINKEGFMRNILTPIFGHHNRNLYSKFRATITYTLPRK